MARHAAPGDAGSLLRVVPNGRVHTYGLGMSLLTLMRHPLDAAGSVDLPIAARP